MTDIEILSRTNHHFPDDVKNIILNAMFQARIDERFEVCQKIQEACIEGDIPDSSENVLRIILR